MLNRINPIRPYLHRVRAEGIGPSLRKAGNLPLLYRHSLRVLGIQKRHSNPYRDSASFADELQFAADLLQSSVEDVRAFAGELETDHDFVQALERRYHEMRPHSGFNLGRFRIWYAFVRALEPSIVIETGVHDGMSSAVFLKAMERNGKGVLISIDLPSTDQPTKASGPGWLVPVELRERWRLLLGDSKRLLPGAAEQYGPIQMFVHDSDHSQEHQGFEYATVRPHLSPGALVLSDQDYPLASALEEFAHTVSGHHLRVRSVAPTAKAPQGNYVGGVRLP